jgi:hypothetical protein
MSDPGVLAPRNGLRKFLYGLAIASMLMALGVAGATGWALSSLGSSSVITASLYATSLFFVSVGVVLFVMSKPPRPFDTAD